MHERSWHNRNEVQRKLFDIEKLPAKILFQMLRKRRRLGKQDETSTIWTRYLDSSQDNLRAIVRLKRELRRRGLWDKSMEISHETKAS